MNRWWELAVEAGFPRALASTARHGSTSDLLRLLDLLV